MGSEASAFEDSERSVVPKSLKLWTYRSLGKVMNPEPNLMVRPEPPETGPASSDHAMVPTDAPMTTTAGSRPSAPQSLVQEDPYVLTSDAIETPPVTLIAALRRVGPGMVLAASIVGSGELIATTTLGAQVGFAALWIILVSCAIKPVVQGELGRYTIATGHTGLEGFNRVPGPRLGVSWMVWAWALTVLLTMLQVGGMYGGVAQVLHLLVPAVSRQRLGGDLPGHHHHGPGRWRIRADREAGAGEGGLLLAAHGVRRRRAGAPSGRDPRAAISPRVSAFICRRPDWRRRLPCSASPASAPPSSCSTRTGASRRATRDCVGQRDGTRRGSRGRAAGFASCTSTSSVRWSSTRWRPWPSTCSAPASSIAAGSCRRSAT